MYTTVYYYCMQLMYKNVCKKNLTSLLVTKNFYIVNKYTVEKSIRLLTQHMSVCLVEKYFF